MWSQGGARRCGHKVLQHRTPAPFRPLTAGQLSQRNALQGLQQLDPHQVWIFTQFDQLDQRVPPLRGPEDLLLLCTKANITCLF